MAPQSPSLSIDQLRKLADQGTVFALLDACDEPAVPKRCRQMTEARAVSLYRGDAAVEFAHMAPYLAHLNASDVDWVLAALWTAPWGYFVIARSDLATLRTHFRHFLKTKLPDNTQVLFRFYDPRVLKTYLEASTPSEYVEFFGVVSAFAISSPGDGTGVMLFPRDRHP